MYKADLIEFCNLYGLSYVIDSTNLSSKYRRNAIRMDVLPFLGQYNERLTPSLNRLAETMADENDFMEASTLSAYEKMVSLDNGRYMFPIASYRKLPVALQRRLIKLILNYLPSDSENFDFRKIETVRLRLLQEASSTWSLDLGGGAVGVREYDQAVLFDRTQVVMGEWCYGLSVLPISGELELPEAGGILRWRRASYLDGDHPANKEEAWFDADQLSLPLTVRSRLPGDTMYVMGLNGRKRLKIFLLMKKYLLQCVPLFPSSATTLELFSGFRAYDVLYMPRCKSTRLRLYICHGKDERVRGTGNCTGTAFIV